MNRSIVSATVVGCLVWSQVWADDSAAIKTLEKGGAIVKRDESVAGKPVLSVTYNLLDVTETGIRALKEIEELPTIEFAGAGNTEITPATLRALQGKPSLKSLSISFAKISDESAKILATLRSLEVLELRAQVDISPVATNEILQLTRLKELSISDRIVSDSLLVEIAKLPNLKKLSVRSVFMTNAGIKALHHYPNLNSLTIFAGSAITDDGIRSLSELSLTSLELTYSDVTNEKLKALRKFGGLKSMTLMNAVAVNDEAIPYLAELTELKELNLADASLTKAGLQQLKQSLPKCNVVIDARKRN